jgi:hypothetical protein
MEDHENIQKQKKTKKGKQKKYFTFDALHQELSSAGLLIHET